MITSEKYIAASRPITLRVDGRDFRVEPFDFNKGLHVAQLVSNMSNEYKGMIEEGIGHLVDAVHADGILDMFLGTLQFRGWRPDWLCRAWIKSRIQYLSLEDKLRLTTELSRNFTVALLATKLAARRADKPSRIST
jgi:hypothetical protein